MRWSLRCAVLGLSAAVAFPALGDAPRKAVDLDQTETEDSAPPQTDSTAQPEESERSEVEPVHPGHMKPPPANEEPRPKLPPGQNYTVRHGDTLWDISDSYLSNPWFWPKLWSYNPQIANPHWIYPGNEIHFYPGGGGAATAVEVGHDEQPDVSVGGQYKIGYVPQKALLAQTEGFVTPGELAESGSITSSFEEKDLLASLDKVYIKFNAPQAHVGDQFVVFRTVREVYHPKTGDLLGYLTEIRGTVRVTREGPPLVTAQIDKSFDTVERGDLVGPWGEKFLRNVLRKDNDRSMKGYIVASFVPKIENLGEHHMVFIDRGRKDGVQEGNEFEVLERRDGMEPDLEERWAEGLPTEVIGHLMVVDTKEGASEAVVTHSVRELEVGDHIEMVGAR